MSIIDEASQATEPAVYPVLTRCSSKMIFAGDPYQLSPTILSKDNKVRQCLSRTLMKDVMQKYPERVLLLRTQYRMNKVISDYVSNTSYDGRLIAHDSVKDRIVLDPFNPSNRNALIRKNPANLMMRTIMSKSMNFIDTSMCKFHEQKTGYNNNNIFRQIMKIIRFDFWQIISPKI